MTAAVVGMLATLTLDVRSTLASDTHALQAEAACASVRDAAAIVVWSTCCPAFAIASMLGGGLSGSDAAKECRACSIALAAADIGAVCGAAAYGRERSGDRPPTPRPVKRAAVGGSA